MIGPPPHPTAWVAARSPLPRGEGRVRDRPLFCFVPADVPWREELRDATLSPVVAPLSTLCVQAGVARPEGPLPDLYLILTDFRMSHLNLNRLRNLNPLLRKPRASRGRRSRRASAHAQSGRTEPGQNPYTFQEFGSPSGGAGSACLSPSLSHHYRFRACFRTRRHRTTTLLPRFSNFPQSPKCPRSITVNS